MPMAAKQTLLSHSESEDFVAAMLPAGQAAETPIEKIVTTLAFARDLWHLLEKPRSLLQG